ncbi:MAG: cobalamin synthesis protein/P47K family protein [Herbaspirillum sp.]|nr:cobalamin synthesis protein/P47K family protein [Herbaspirillum sp.]
MGAFVASFEIQAGANVPANHFNHTPTIMSTPDLIPVSLLTGFLGSGKTTLLNHLVHQPAMRDTLVIINEFGEIGLDHLLVAHSEDNVVVEMSSGCLCCTIRGDLQKTLKDAHWRFSRNAERRFNRVFIETTGLADPIPILHTLMADGELADHYRLDGIITTIDAVNGMATLDAHQEAVRQAAVADKLLLTKTDLIEAPQLAALQQRLSVINPGAPQTPILNGVIDVESLHDLGLFKAEGKTLDVQKWLNEEAFHEGAAAHAEHHDHGHEHVHDSHQEHQHAGHKHAAHDDHAHDVNRHDDHIRAFCFTFDEPIDPVMFEDWLTLLLTMKGGDMLRLKGILNLAGRSGPTVIHGVQHIFHPTVELPEWPSADHSTRIVFITRDIERDLIERTFAAFNRTHKEVAAAPR